MSKNISGLDKILYQIILDAEKNKEAGEKNLFLQITPATIDKAKSQILQWANSVVDEVIPVTRDNSAIKHQFAVWHENNGYNQAIDDMRDRKDKLLGGLNE